MTHKYLKNCELHRYKNVSLSHLLISKLLSREFFCLGFLVFEIFLTTILSILPIWSVLSATESDIHIISRSEWWADESLRYADSPVWKVAYDAHLQYLSRPKTQSELDAIRLDATRLAFLQNLLPRDTEVVTRKRTENWHPLIWPIETVRQVSRIIIHHSDTEMDTTKTDKELIQGIYRYHTLTRQWGDIGYNYIIWQRWDIYEWRTGGDYVVWSHAAYNNMGSVGIMVLGNYDRDHLNRDQLIGIERLVTYLAKKYGIDISRTHDGVIKCDTAICSPFRVVHTASLLTHGDVGTTSCPGHDISEKISWWIQDWRVPYSPILNTSALDIDLLPISLQMNVSLKPIQSVVSVASIPLIKPIRYIWPKFRVKLSYPDDQSIMLSSQDGKNPVIKIDGKKIPQILNQKVTVWIVWNTILEIKIWDKTYTGKEIQFSHSVVRIDSWSRVPDWDKNKKYNDNLFRDTIRVINQNGKLLVINDLPLEWYLKGMWEVSNSDPSEKIKTIVVAARSYARWYMDPLHRKFSTRLYDGSDNPDEFQKYLGYSYEMRSPQVSKMVDVTRNQVIIYAGSLIKPWYHSSSDGRTLSALEYCQNSGWKNCTDTPYLQSVVDPGWVWHIRSGHGVGISGIGATYWAGQGWDYPKIIQYYLKGVEIMKK